MWKFPHQTACVCMCEVVEGPFGDIDFGRFIIAECCHGS